MADFNIKGKLTGFDDINKGFDNLNQSAKTTNTTFSQIAKVGAAAAAVGVAAVSAAIISGGKELLAYGDHVQKLSLRLGVSAEALSEYKLIADLTGVSTTTLTTAWQRQTRRISEASKGTGVAVKALEELGIQVEDINRMKPDEQFELLADALDGVALQSDKVRLAMQIWDTEGVALLQTVEGGSAALKEMRDWSEKLGLTLTQKSVNDIAKFNDRVTLLKGAFDGMIQKSLVALLPMLEDLGDIFFDAAIEGDGFAEAAETITNVLKGLVAGAVIVKNIIDALAASFASTAAAAVLASKGKFQEAWNALKQGGEDVQSDFEDVTSTIEKLFDDSGAAAEESKFKIIAESKAAAKESTEAWRLYEENLKINEKAAQDELKAGWDAYNENLKINNEATTAEIDAGWKAYHENLAINEQAAVDELAAGWRAYEENLKINQAATAAEVQAGWDAFYENEKLNKEALAKQNEEIASVSGNHLGKMFDSIGEGIEKSIGDSEWWSERFKAHRLDMAEFAASIFTTITEDFGEAVAGWVVKGEEFDMKETFENMAAQFVAMTVTMATEWAILTVLVNTGAIEMAASGAIVNVAWAPLLITVVAIAAGIYAIIYAIENWDKVSRIAGDALNIAFWPVKVTLEAIVSVIDWLIGGIEHLTDVGGIAGAALNIAFLPFLATLEAIKIAINAVTDPLGTVETVWDTSTDVVSSIADGAWGVASGSTSPFDVADAVLDVFGISPFANGGEFLTQGSQLLMVGENGQERVSVSPAGTAAGMSGGGGGNTQVFNGPVIMDSVTAAKFARMQMNSINSEVDRFA